MPITCITARTPLISRAARRRRTRQAPLPQQASRACAAVDSISAGPLSGLHRKQNQTAQVLQYESNIIESNRTPRRSSHAHRFSATPQSLLPPLFTQSGKTYVLQAERPLYNSVTLTASLSCSPLAKHYPSELTGGKHARYRWAWQRVF